MSGHGSRDEIRAMLQAARPKFLLPVHGEARHLHLHARLAQSTGLTPENVFILSNGAAWATDGQTAWQEKPVPASDVLVAERHAWPAGKGAKAGGRGRPVERAKRPFSELAVARSGLLVMPEIQSRPAGLPSLARP